MKPYIVVQGPVATRSGYGNHTRDLVTSLINADKYLIDIVSLPWGNTAMNALKEDNKEHKAILDRIVRQNITRKPDIFIQISVANEFNPVGKYNIGITAGVETNAVPHEFIQNSNKMDLIIVPSEFSKKGFEVIYDKLDNNKVKQGEVKLEKPIEVLFEGLDLNTYKKTDKLATIVKEEMNNITDDFNFLFVGHWLKGDLGHDRKDVGMMIKTFCEAFKRKAKRNRPGLILKTSHARMSIMDRDIMFKKIQAIIEPYGKDIPNIYLLHGDFTDEEMNSIYNHSKVKAMVSFTKGEGFGRPLLEFGITGKPIIASNWSGHTDFLHKDHCFLLPGNLNEIHSSAADKFLTKGTSWFTVEYAYAAKVLQDVMANYKNYLSKSRKQMKYIKDNFTRAKMEDKFNSIIEEKLKDMPQQMDIKLPTLKKLKI